MIRQHEIQALKQVISVGDPVEFVSQVPKETDRNPLVQGVVKYVSTHAFGVVEKDRAIGTTTFKYAEVLMDKPKIVFKKDVRAEMALVLK